MHKKLLFQAQFRHYLEQTTPKAPHHNRFSFTKVNKNLLRNNPKALALLPKTTNAFYQNLQRFCPKAPTVSEKPSLVFQKTYNTFTQNIRNFHPICPYLLPKSTVCFSTPNPSPHTTPTSNRKKLPQKHTPNPQY